MCRKVELTSCCVEPCGGAQAFPRGLHRSQQVLQGVLELRVLQGVIPEGPVQLPLGVLSAPCRTGAGYDVCFRTGIISYTCSKRSHEGN